MRISPLAFGLAVAAAFGAGYCLSRTGTQPPRFALEERLAPEEEDVSPLPEFGGIRVNDVRDYVALIRPEDPEVNRLAKRLSSYEEAYAYVSGNIRYVPHAPPGPVGETLRRGQGSCLGKAALLCSLYRAMGMPTEDVRIVTGIVVTPQGPADHVWLDLEHRGACFQQDPSGFLGEFDFDAFHDNGFVDAYVMKELYCFNDEGFALVSQMNRFRD